MNAKHYALSVAVMAATAASAATIGKVVVNHVTAAIGDKAAYSGAVEVKDSATLAINAGKKLTSGAMTVESGAA
ncbi:MAG: hypothetical protein II863_00170, partial [Kiritimatiellae bacterium]|nr:hypothetical protein [Kiritimatiellia bacterium]